MEPIIEIPLTFPPKLTRGVRIYEQVINDTMPEKMEDTLFYDEDYNKIPSTFVEPEHQDQYQDQEKNHKKNEEDIEPRTFAYSYEKYNWVDDLLELQEKKRTLLKKSLQEDYRKIAKQKLQKSTLK